MYVYEFIFVNRTQIINVRIGASVGLQEFAEKKKNFK